MLELWNDNFSEIEKHKKSIDMLTMSKQKSTFLDPQGQFPCPVFLPLVQIWFLPGDM